MKDCLAIETVSEFLDSLAALEAEGLENDMVYFYRGQSDKAWELVPSLFRGYRHLALRSGNGSCWGTTKVLASDEERICAAVKRRYYKEFADSRGRVDDLAIMQHYGVPTRLLDVTRNSFVALYFACMLRDKEGMNVPVHIRSGKYSETFRKRYENCHDKAPDGAVYVFRETRRAVHDAEIGSASLDKLANPGLYSSNAVTRRKFFKELGVKVRDLRPHLVMPTYHVERQRRQSSFFYLVPNLSDKRGCVSESPSGFDGDKVSRIIVKGSAKRQILDELEMRCGITRSFLFPESMCDYVDELIAQVRREQFASTLTAIEYE